ncbi:MAG TPA: tRNA (adenosine(37)-N6)-threonylcarbamoyltransferase complex dimerization subunit type 1 TsaB [Thermomicrobiales bacterium]|nr:tRNA (adenosine(37)-N6)-threonylcarbamoyltransferase complex dimerization subunit type 1 TsaB [Thermomicrobiales bacterium]
MTDAQWLLALDTSTDWAGIALTDGEVLAELNWTAGRRQTTQVMPEVERLLGTVNVTAAQLGAVAVATGPGSFSGLRVGLAIANGLSIATGIPVLGVSTIELTIHAWRDLPGMAIGVVKAGRSRYGWASADAIDEPLTGTIGELIEFVRVHDASIVLGELSEEDVIRVRELTGVIVPPTPDRLRRAGTLARMGWERWRSGDFDPRTIPDPVYLHRTEQHS